MFTNINILILGPTAYIGGSVLSLLLAREDLKNMNITALVRFAEKAEMLKTLGINAVVGSPSDQQLVERLALESDVVFSLADSKNVDTIKALLKGLKRRYDETGRVPIVIHKSGADAVASSGDGTFDESAMIYVDADSKQMANINQTHRYRVTDLELVSADTSGYVKAYIVMSAPVFGTAKTLLTKLGIQDEYSYVVTRLTDISLDRKQASVIGDGNNIWPHVSIEDISSLYMMLYDSALNDPRSAHGTEGYYFGENGECNVLTIANKIGEALFELGKINSPDPVSLPHDQVIKYFGVPTPPMGGNCRCRGVRSRALGWKPSKSTDDILESIKTDVKAFIETRKSDH